MPDDPKYFFWDSCVFYAYLANETLAYDVASIAQYLDEAKAGNLRIYTSTLAMAEVVPSKIMKPDIGSFQEFCSDFGAAIVMIEPNPNIMHMASLFKDVPYRCKDKSAKPRRLSTTDAIMFASCIYQRDVVGVPITEFHTFDDGKTRSLDGGRAVPLLSYQDWLEALNDSERLLIKPIVDLVRRKPSHPHPKLNFTVDAPQSLAQIQTSENTPSNDGSASNERADRSNGRDVQDNDLSAGGSKADVHSDEYNKTDGTNARVIGEPKRKEIGPTRLTKEGSDG